MMKSKTFKRVLSILLCAIMLFGSAPLAGFVGLDLPGIGDLFAQKAEAVKDGYYYYYVSNGEVTITGVDTSISGDVAIPSTLGGYPVTNIGDEAFSAKKDITSITIPDSVTSIGYEAFYWCTRLTSITFGENSQLTSIGYEAFCWCTRLASITFGENSQLTSIGEDAFERCTSLTSITFGENSQLTSIGNSAFRNCTSLTSITIPNSVMSIGDYTFCNCTSLTSVEFGENSQLISIGDHAFYYCESLASITIPGSMTSIGVCAFEHCTSLVSITIPDSVTSIGISAFYGCTSLASIIVDSKNKNYSNDECGVLFDKEKTELIFYPEGKTITNYVISNSVMSIGNCAFSGYTNLASIAIPNSVTSIGYEAFSDCTSLASVEFGENSQLISIGYGAFYGCTSLTSIVIPDSVTSIGYEAFYHCTSLASITIPDSVTSIGDYAFRDCTSLASVEFGENSQLISIGYGAFYDCTSLTSITIPDSVTSIGYGAFHNCTNLFDVYYGGTKGEWSEISIGDNNECLTNATIHFSIPYTLTYNANGGNGAPSSQSGNTSYTISSTVPIRSGYKFLGWSKSSSATSASYAAGDTIILTANTVLYAVWSDLVKPTENIYNLGEETYSFDNFGDYDSPFGHCFGMSMTSAGYYNNYLQISNAGINDVRKINTLTRTDSVKRPICYYQPIQGKYSTSAIVAGGSCYKRGTSNISSDWNEVINYVKNHDYDNKGSLQIGFRNDSQGGHAINFLYYKEVSGQQRIYAYDNNFPKTETYFYKAADGKIYQAPYSTFSGAIDCIALRDVAKYFELAKEYNSSRYCYAKIDNIAISSADVYQMECDIVSGQYYMFELPKSVDCIVITPLVDNAEFTYNGKTYSFGVVDDETVGIFQLATGSDDNYGAELTIVDKSEITSVTIGSPSTTTISYGDSIVLHANIKNLPTGARVVWEASNGNFSYSVSSDGTACTISPKSSGDTEFTAKIVDSNGKVISSDTQKMTSKAGFWQKLIAFFKSLFGSNQVIPYTVKSLFR